MVLLSLSEFEFWDPPRASVFAAVAVTVMLVTSVIDCREERMAAPTVPEGFEFTAAMFAEIVASSLS
jgi:hypothetical protein